MVFNMIASGGEHPDASVVKWHVNNVANVTYSIDTYSKTATITTSSMTAKPYAVYINAGIAINISYLSEVNIVEDSAAIGATRWALQSYTRTNNGFTLVLTWTWSGSPSGGSGSVNSSYVSAIY